jgi:hypothetical protein
LAEQALAIGEPSFRAGYRSAVLALCAEREQSWLWSAAPAPRETTREASR